MGKRGDVIDVTTAWHNRTGDVIGVTAAWYNRTAIPPFLRSSLCFSSHEIVFEMGPQWSQRSGGGVRWSALGCQERR